MKPSILILLHQLLDLILVLLLSRHYFFVDFWLVLEGLLRSLFYFGNRRLKRYLILKFKLWRLLRDLRLLRRLRFLLWSWYNLFPYFTTGFVDLDVFRRRFLILSPGAPRLRSCLLRYFRLFKNALALLWSLFFLHYSSFLLHFSLSVQLRLRTFLHRRCLLLWPLTKQRIVLSILPLLLQTLKPGLHMDPIDFLF